MQPLYRLYATADYSDDDGIEISNTGIASTREEISETIRHLIASEPKASSFTFIVILAC